MEYPAILKLNVERFRGPLEMQADADQRQMVLALLRRMEAERAPTASRGEIERQGVRD